MLVRLKFFLQFVEKMKKFKLSLLKQHNKMLKMISEMLKTRKKSKIIKLGKISREFSEFQAFSKSREFLGITRNQVITSAIPEKVFENFSFSGKLKIREKRNPNASRCAVNFQKVDAGRYAVKISAVLASIFF